MKTTIFLFLLSLLPEPLARRAYLRKPKQWVEQGRRALRARDQSGKIPEVRCDLSVLEQPL